jgi:hypothetical protein
LHGLVTPRHVLREIKGAKDKPWWTGKLAGEIERVWRGMGVLDEQMSEASAEALLAETIKRVQRPMNDKELAEAFARYMPEGRA